MTDDPFADAVIPSNSFQPPVPPSTPSSGTETNQEVGTSTTLTGEQQTKIGTDGDPDDEDLLESL